jgi:hypothetical protein
VKRLAARLGVEAHEPKVASYYHELEQGLIPANRSPSASSRRSASSSAAAPSGYATKAKRLAMAARRPRGRCSRERACPTWGSSSDATGRPRTRLPRVVTGTKWTSSFSEESNASFGPCPAKADGLKDRQSFEPSIRSPCESTRALHTRAYAREWHRKPARFVPLRNRRSQVRILSGALQRTPANTGVSVCRFWGRVGGPKSG